MSQLCIYLNDAELTDEVPVVFENMPLTVRVEPPEGLPLQSLSLQILGGPRLEGVISLRRMTSVEWPIDLQNAAGSMVLVLHGEGFSRRIQLRVEPAKLTSEEYQFLLCDLRRMAYDVMYTIYAPTHQGLAKHPPTEDQFQRLLQRFEILEQSGAVEETLRLVGRLGHHHTIASTLEISSVEHVRRLPQASLRTIACDPERRHVLGRQKRITVNNDENRMVKLLLRSLRRIAHVLDMEAASALRQARPIGDGTRRRLEEIQAISHRWKHGLQATLALEPWSEVGDTVNLGRPSMVFMKDPIYRGLLQWYRFLRDNWGLSFDSAIFLLPVREVHKLYEMWCFLQVISALQRGLDHPGLTRTLYRPRLGGFEFVLDQGEHSKMVFTPRGARITVYYNKSYPSFTGLTYRPDVTVEVRTEDGRSALIVLDAKYRIDAEDECSTFKQEDIDKMHTYRDAVRWGRDRVDSAFILYPGENQEVWGDGAIGAIPLRPSRQEDMHSLDMVLGRCLGRLGIPWRAGDK